MTIITRRTALVGMGATLLTGCDRLGENPDFAKLLSLGETGNFHIQRALTDRMALAPEYRPDQMSPRFQANGTREPKGLDYARAAAEGFANWQIVVDGLVERPQAFTLGQIKSLPTRTQITRHDCVEGWSAIGQWTGPTVSQILNHVRLKPDARFIIFHCADIMGGGQRYYESLDLVDAFHTQTILAWAMNGAPVPIANGAPVRLRVERQLGYKHAKYVNRIEAVADLSKTYGGKGGYWEDVGGYEWYAGI
jgi:DMSO/TMAO reductase YedYZ molybdopterin-dependent catalytic subunit